MGGGVCCRCALLRLNIVIIPDYLLFIQTTLPELLIFREKVGSKRAAQLGKSQEHESSDSLFDAV